MHGTRMSLETVHTTLECGALLSIPLLSLTPCVCSSRQIVRLCLGAFHSAALSDQGDVYAWGEGRFGATGVDLSRDSDKEVRKPARVLGRACSNVRKRVRLLPADGR